MCSSNMYLPKWIILLSIKLNEVGKRITNRNWGGFLFLLMSCLDCHIGRYRETTTTFVWNGSNVLTIKGILVRKSFKTKNKAIWLLWIRLLNKYVFWGSILNLVRMGNFEILIFDGLFLATLIKDSLRSILFLR